MTSPSWAIGTATASTASGCTDRRPSVAAPRDADRRRGAAPVRLRRVRRRAGGRGLERRRHRRCRGVPPLVASGSCGSQRQVADRTGASASARPAASRSSATGTATVPTASVCSARRPPTGCFATWRAAAASTSSSPTTATDEVDHLHELVAGDGEAGAITGGADEVAEPARERERGDGGAGIARRTPGATAGAPTANPRR